MTVIEFLADYAELVARRAAREAIEVSIMYNEELIDGVTYSTVSIASGDSGLEISVAHPLTGVLADKYKPVLEDDQWELFLRQVKPHRYPPTTSTVQ